MDRHPANARADLGLDGGQPAGMSSSETIAASLIVALALAAALVLAWRIVAARRRR